MTVMDLQGFSISTMWNKTTTGFLKEAAKIGQDYYPETMGKMFIINAPFVFSSIWSMVKGWIDEKTRKKISILGSGYSKQL
jgi:hypothetical protein